MRKNLRDFDLAIIDTELTGLSLKHEIIEIAVMRISAYDFSILDEWEAKIKPKRIEIAEPEALRVNGYNEKEWEDAMDAESAMKIFLEKTDNCILVGHNLAALDFMQITKTLEEYNLPPTFWFKSIDTFALGWQKLRNDPRIRSLSLEELARYFGIKSGPAHRALNDCKKTYEVFLKLLSI